MAVARKLSAERITPASVVQQQPLRRSVARSKVQTPSVKSRTTSPAKETALQQQEKLIETSGATSAAIMEEIEDLALLEKMMSAATNYDDRSRIRAQLRIAKKNVGIATTTKTSLATN